MDVRAGKKKKRQKGGVSHDIAFIYLYFFAGTKIDVFRKLNSAFFFSFFSFYRTGKNQNKKESLITKNARQ